MAAVSPFLARTWHEQDIVVEEVGYYSVYGELAGDNFEMREDRSLLRQVAIPCPPGGVVHINRRLQHVPVAEFEGPPARFQGDEAMACLNRWLGLRVQDLNLRTFWQEVEFITTNRVLSQIMKIPYSTDTHGANEWAFGAAKVRGKIFVGYISREGFCDLSQNVPLEDQQAQNRAWTESSHRNRQFEEIILRNTRWPHPPAKFHSVTHTNFGGTHLLIASTIDAEDDQLPGVSDYPSKYVALQNGATWMLRPPQHFLSTNRMFRWWATNALNGVGSVRSGFYDAPGPNNPMLGADTLREIRTYRVADLPDIAHDPQNHINCTYAPNCRYEAKKWNSDACLTFLHRILCKVRQEVTLDHTEAVYEFHGRRDVLNHATITDLNSVTVQTVPVSDARYNDHTYLP